MTSAHTTAHQLPPLLRYEGVSYGMKAAENGAARPVFRDLSLTVSPGELWLLSAPSGGGKTAAVRAAIGAQPGVEGEITCLGQRLSALSPRELLQLRQRVGFVPASGGLLSNLSPHDNLTLLWRYHDAASPDAIAARAREVCQELGLGSLDGRALPDLSRTEQHLLAIGRAWLPQPPLLILDAPDFGLADAAATALWRRLATLRARHNVAMLCTTSRPHLAARHGGHVRALQPTEAP